MNCNNKLYNIHNMIKNKRFEEAEIELNKEKNNLINFSKSYYSLLIRTKVNLRKFDEVYNIIISNKLMKRDYLKYIEFSRSIEKSQKVFKKC